MPCNVGGTFYYLNYENQYSKKKTIVKYVVFKKLDTIDIFQSVAFQTWEILNSMQLDSKLELKALLVDGGMTKNELLMQTQADFLGQ